MAVRIGKEAAQGGALDALFIHPHYPMDFWPVVPFGCLSLALYLDAQGYATGLWDGNHDPRADDEALREVLRTATPRLVGLSLLSTQLDEARRLARLIRDILPETRIVAGGQHFSMDSAGTLPEADVVVVADGEQVVAELLSGELDEATIRRAGPGRSGSEPCSAVVRGQRLSDLNAVPLPGRDIWRMYHGFGVFSRIGLMVTRGCPFDCTFCYTKDRSRKCSRYAPERVGQVIADAHAETHLREVFFIDDIFTLNRDWVMDVCAEIYRRGLDHLDYICLSHIRVGDRELYRAMAQAGFRQVMFGVEAGDAGVRKRMHKDFPDQAVYKAFDLVRACGMKPHSLFILGYTGETTETMRRTLEMAEALRATTWFSLAQPLPGTVFHDEARREGRILEDDLSRYDNTKIVYLPEGVTLEEMRVIQSEAEELRLRLEAEYGLHAPDSRGDPEVSETA